MIASDNTQYARSGKKCGIAQKDERDEREELELLLVAVGNEA